MIELVYFGEELCNRAPGVVGCLYHGAGKEWVFPLQAVEAVRLKMPLTIRPATESEMKRAEALVAVYEIGVQISEKLNLCLDQELTEAVQEKKEQLAAQFSAAASTADLLDKE